MQYDIIIGDTIIVTDVGHQYTTYVSKAAELGADVAGSRPKWRSDGLVDKGNKCEVINMDEKTCHVLIERTSDGRQFLIDEAGLKVIERSMFSDADFLV